MNYQAIPDLFKAAAVNWVLDCADGAAWLALLAAAVPAGE